VKIDNFIILSDMMIAPGKNEMNYRNHTVTGILNKYREKVNPEMLFVAIDLFGNGKSIVDINTDHPKNVLITGFSDNILKFIAERGTQKQLEYVMKIDEIKLNKSKGSREQKGKEEK